MITGDCRPSSRCRSTLIEELSVSTLMVRVLTQTLGKTWHSVKESAKSIRRNCGCEVCLVAPPRGATSPCITAGNYPVGPRSRVRMARQVRLRDRQRRITAETQVSRLDPGTHKA